MQGEKHPPGLYERDTVFFHTMIKFALLYDTNTANRGGAEPSFFNEYSNFLPNIVLNFQTCFYDVLIWIYIYVYIQPEIWYTPYSNNDTSVYYLNINSLNDDPKWLISNLSIKGFKADLR